MATRIRQTGFYKVIVEPAVKGVLVFIFIGSALFSLASFIWYRNNVMRLANEVYQMEKKLNSLALQKEKSQSRILQLENYSRILKIAGAEIGMKPAIRKPRVLEVPEKEYQLINGN